MFTETRTITSDWRHQNQRTHTHRINRSEPPSPWKPVTARPADRWSSTRFASVGRNKLFVHQVKQVDLKRRLISNDDRLLECGGFTMSSSSPLRRLLQPVAEAFLRSLLFMYLHEVIRPISLETRLKTGIKHCRLFAASYDLHLYRHDN